MTVGMLILIGLAFWICGTVAVLGWKLVNHLGKEVPLDGSRQPAASTPPDRPVDPPASGDDR